MIIILVSSVPYAAFLSHSRGLMAAGITVPGAIATISGAATNVVLNIVFVPPLGIVGSALATGCADVAMYFILRIFSVRSERLSGPPRALAAALGISGVVSALLILLPAGTPFLLLRVALAAASGVMIPAIIFVLTGRSDPAVLRRIADRLGDWLDIQPL
jgi:Na+-driven multidrug efflux pump